MTTTLKPVFRSMVYTDWLDVWLLEKCEATQISVILINLHKIKISNFMSLERQLLQLYRTIPSKEMVKVIAGMISQRHFYVHIGNRKSRRRTVLNGVSQGSVIVPALFNLYTHDLPVTLSKKYIYADDIAFLSSDNNFLTIEKSLSHDFRPVERLLLQLAPKAQYHKNCV